MAGVLHANLIARDDVIDPPGLVSSAAAGHPGSASYDALGGMNSVHSTPLEPAPPALARGLPLFLKREDLHELGAFKWRGALPALEHYRRGGATAVVTATTGNNGVATAWAARRLGMEAIVFAPEGATRAKLEQIESLDARLCLAGGDYGEAKKAATAFSRRRSVPFFEDGANPAQYTGYGAIGCEILDALPTTPSTIIVPVGNGTLVGGIGQTLGGQPDLRLIGVVAKEAPVMALSWRQGAPVHCARRGRTIADGLAVQAAIPYALRRVTATVDEMLLVSERELAEAVRDLNECGFRVEAAGAAPLAAIRQLDDVAGTTVLVITGRNIDDDLHARICASPKSFGDEQC